MEELNTIQIVKTKTIFKCDYYNYQMLNWLYSYISEKTDYLAIPKKYFNVGESQIEKLEVLYFDSEEIAREYFKIIFDYYGKSFNDLKIDYEEVIL